MARNDCSGRLRSVVTECVKSRPALRTPLYLAVGEGACAWPAPDLSDRFVFV
jgi:hypothetical protein